MSRSSKGGSAGGKSYSQEVTELKSRSLLTKGEKLIVLRNALFDDDEGGFGAERDVTRWLAAPFRTFAKNGMNCSIEFAHGESLMGQDLQDLVGLAEVFAEEVEEDAGREYHSEDKEEHLTEDAARFLIARDESGKIVGFAHFRFTLHGELADVMEGSPCLFVYDVHISEGVQRKGLGRHLLTMLELIARKGNMYEMVMPVPKSDLAEGATAFALGGLKGWALDDLSEVAPKTARAIAEDGSLSVYVKVLKARDAPAVVEPKVAVTEAAAPLPAAEVEDDWGLAAPPAPGSAGKSKKSSGKKGGKKSEKKGKTAVSGPAAAAPGSSVGAPLAVGEE